MKSKSLWNPSDSFVNSTNLTKFINFLSINNDFSIDTSLNSEAKYKQLYNWSIHSSEEFWSSFLHFSNIKYYGDIDFVCDDVNKMPGAIWFSGIQMNFAENLLSNRDDRIAIHFYGEDRIYKTLTFKELYNQVSKLVQYFKSINIKKGDRICAYTANTPEAVIGMLAASSIGAIWSSCSPDFGVKGVLDRFSQIKPKVIIASDGYYFKGEYFSSIERVHSIVEAISSIEKTIIYQYDTSLEKKALNLSNIIFFDEILSKHEVDEIMFEKLSFSDPLYIMYSSGTTGKPKSIVHSLGGTLIQHYKELILHTNLNKDDVIFYYTTCGWMMWNWLVTSLGIGSSIVLYDGNPFYPNPDRLLNIIDDIKIKVFGTSAKYISELERLGVDAKGISSFDSLESILSTGSPLTEESFEYVYNKWKEDVQLSSISGGTDIISCFALGNPILPVYKGELQCIGLGMKVQSFDEFGKDSVGTKGELVCTQAFPSMPISFWNDEDGNKYHKAYFNTFDNVWKHGDYIEIFEHGGVKIYGRSDATLNPGGVRIGTSEIYRVIDQNEDIEDSVVVGLNIDGEEKVVLFVKLNSTIKLSSALKNKIKLDIKMNCSPKHVPSFIYQTPDIPYTINGKKIELAVKNIIEGYSVSNKDSISNPESLLFFEDFSIDV
ncbi:MAG: acetoacetate--CoA ligase [Candidatus Marinimicrobia bacterium]|nr:acetoacetate--CoA ligase [Candidatus Neomarinimicrobiota bacterium]